MIDLSKPIFLLIAVCAVSFASFAQTNADIDFDIDSIPIHTLNEVIVTANRFTEVIPSQKLTGKELEGLNSLSVADALRYFSGIQLILSISFIDFHRAGDNNLVSFLHGKFQSSAVSCKHYCI